METAPSSVATTTTAPPPSTTVTTVPPETTVTSSTTTTTAAPQASAMFAWMPGGLTEEFPEVVASIPGVEASSTLTTVTMHLTSSHTADGSLVDEPPPGYVIPMHGALVEATTLGPVLELPVIGGDELILGEGSARLRRLGVGDNITFETGATLSIGAIVAEDLMAGYEAIAVYQEHFDEERMEARAVLVQYHGNPLQLKNRIAERVADDVVFDVRERRRSADHGGLVVRSQVFIKENFGEFAYRPTGNGRFTIDPGWVEENIVDVRIPLLGQTRCHTRMAEILTTIMTDLEANGLSNVIDRSAFAGCWNARYIAGSYRLSRHSFGAAADINIFNPTDGGPGSPVHPELLKRIYAAGLTSGHVWRNPDPGHFEFFEIAETS